MSDAPDRDSGLTDPLDDVVPAALRPVLDAVDGRAGIAVDDDGIELRQALRTRRIPWDHVSTIHLDSRLDVVLGAGARFVPLRRVPLIGGLLVDGLQRLASVVTRRVAPGVRDQSGWAIVTIERSGLRLDVDVEGGPFLAGLFSPELVDAIESHARMRHIPIERD